MAQPSTISADVFPDNRSLCECCGYPLRDLSRDADCPECGSAVLASAPDHRRGFSKQYDVPTVAYLHSAPAVLFRPSRSFRNMRIDADKTRARQCLGLNALLATALWTGIGYRAIGGGDLLQVFLLGWVGVYVLTYIEMLGVTAFSRRRGWRVPFSLAERVCCYASVGWLPGVLLASGGAWLLRVYAVGEPWFESMLGLVRVAWLFYGGLFLVSLLWFETLVWLGVRQVRYANRTSGQSEESIANRDFQPSTGPS